jgi:hypothetical protein
MGSLEAEEAPIDLIEEGLLKNGFILPIHRQY